MAQDMNQIIKLLKDMKKCNTAGAENIDKLLECINSSIDMKNEKEGNKLLEEYISELVNSIEEKYLLTSSQTKNIEKAIKALYTSSKDSFDSPEINKSFDNFLNFVKDFYVDCKQKKTTLANLKSKITKTKNLSDGATISEIKSELLTANREYRKLTDDLIKNLKPIVSFLADSEFLTSDKSAQKHSSSILNGISEIVNSLQQHSAKDASLEEIYKSLATSQNLKYTQGIVDCIISKAQEAEVRYDNAMNSSVRTQSSDTITMTKDEYFDLKKCTEEISLNTDEVKQALGKVAKDIEKLPDTTSLEKPLFNVYNKLDNLLANISASNVKGDIFDLNSSFSLLREDLSTVKNIIEDLNDVLSNKIELQAKNLGPNTDVNSLRETIFKMAELIPTKEDIENLLTKMELELSSSKNDIEDIKNSQINIENSITNLASKEDVSLLDEKISEIKFDREFSDIYNKTTSIEDWLVKSKIKETTEDIANKIINKAEQEDIVNLKEQISAALSKLSEKDTIDILGSTLSDVSKKIEKIQEEFLSSNQIIDNKTTHIEDQLVSISEYISNLPANDEIIKEKIEEIKTLIEEKYHFEKDKTKQYDDMVDKITENIGNFISDKCKIVPNEEINDAIMGIRSAISETKEDQALQLTKVVETIGNINAFVNKKNDIDTDLRYSISELDGLKIQISEIIDLLKKNEEAKMSENEQTFDAYTQNINNFISEKLEEMKNDLSSNASSNESQLQQGFVYNTELIEEKTDAILNLIKNSANKSDNQETYNENFKNIEEKLSDFKQQIELLNTDLVENLTSKTESINHAILPLKEQLSNILSNTSFYGLENKFEELKSVIEAQTLDSNSEETSFDNISKNLSDLENNIRDYILSDIDSVIIKVDELRDYIDSSIKAIVPPDPKKMQELHEYVKNLNEFQKSQQDLIQNATDLIQENMASQHEEIKTLIEDSMKPMEEVKSILTSGTFQGNSAIDSSKQLEAIQEEISKNNESLKSMLTVAMNHDEIISAIENLKTNFEEKFRTIKLGNNKGKAEVIPSNIEDLRDDLSHYTAIIEKLSGQNTEITNVLKGFKENFTNIGASSADTETNFDFPKAFEMLKDDINLLKVRIDKVLADNNEDNATGSKLEKVSELSNNNWLENINKYLSESKLGSMMELLNTKIDILAEGSSDNMLEELADNFDEIEDHIENVNKNITQISDDIENVNSNIVNVNETVGSVNSSINELNENFDSVKDDLTDINDNVININSNLINVNENIGSVHSGVIEVNDNLESLHENINEVNNNINGMREDLLDIHGAVGTVQDNISNVIAPIEESIGDLTITDAKITSMLETLNKKIDLISETGGSISDFEEVKELIHEQKDYIESLEPNSEMEALKNCLDNLSEEVNKLSEKEDNEAIKGYIKEMKETLMGAVVNIFDQVSFVQESEDIKDFVEERTDQINENIAQITKQLQQISTSGDHSDYSYSMQDIETDLSKLRLALNEIQNSNAGLTAGELAQITEKLHSITSSVDSLTQDEMKALKDEITNIKEQTRFLIVSADKSYNAMVGEDFGGKINTITKMLEKSHNSDNVVRQALIYMGEWIDSASNEMSRITQNSDDIKSIIDSLKAEIPGQTKILNILEDKIQNLEMQVVTMKNIENEMTTQQERIDRLEMNIDKILSAVENMDDFGLTGKVEKIDKQLSKLSTNIEKLAAYVD